MKREQGKKASQKKARLNLTPFVWGGGARSSRAARVRSLEREFIKRGGGKLA
ncbi:hypothetical protein ACULYO_000317 [Campylobacter upsaliensis]